LTNDKNKKKNGKFCTSCGARLKPGAKSCSNCGSTTQNRKKSQSAKKQKINKSKKKSKLLVISIIGSIMVLLAIVGWVIQGQNQPYYVGMGECVKCHQKEVQKMKSNPVMFRMMTAIERLQGADLNNSKCLGCHTTGYQKKWDKSVPFADRLNVQCEACHGPGSKYIKVMDSEYKSNDDELRKKAIAAGLIISPKKDTCFQCHHDGDIRPDGSRVIWDFDSSKAKIGIH